MSPATDRYGTEDVVWLLSHSEAAIERYVAALTELARHGPRRLRVMSAVFVRGEPLENPPPLAPHQRLAASIVTLDAESVANDSFRAWTRSCADLLRTRPEFRLFLDTGGVPVDALPADESVAMLVGLAQSSARTDAEIFEALRAHLARLTAIDAAANWYFAQNVATVAVGRIAGMARGLAVPAMLLIVFFTPWTEAAAVLIGMVLFGSVVGFAYGATALLRHDRRPVRFLPRSGVLLILASALMAWKEPPQEWVWPGIVAGVLLDAGNRAGLLASRRRASQHGAIAAVEDERLAELLADDAWHEEADPYAGPVLPPDDPRVFISYTRASQWGRDTARTLHATLTDAGMVCFLDANSIDEGSAWPAALTRALGEADVFLGLLDDETVRHRWVAAEWLVVLHARMLTGWPELAVLRPPGAHGVPAQSLPVFRAVLARGAAPIIEVTPEALRGAAAGVRELAATGPSVLPAQARPLLALASLPLVAVGSFSSLLGIAAALFAYLEYTRRYSGADVLTPYGLLPPALLLTAFCAGFAMRLALHALLDPAVEHPVAQSRLQLFGTVAFLALALSWLPRVSPLTVAWACVAPPIGWLVAEVFVRTTALQARLGRRGS